MPHDTFFKINKDKQKRVINAAKDVFSNYEYSRVTIDRIVKEAGIPKGSFYRYFSNKDDLFVYMFFDLGVSKKEFLKKFIDLSMNEDFSEFLMLLDEKGNEFEVETRERRILRQKFYFECPQHIMRNITNKLLPETYELFSYAIEKYQRMGIVKTGINLEQAGYIIASCFYNQTLFPVKHSRREELKETIKNVLGYLLV